MSTKRALLKTKRRQLWPKLSKKSRLWLKRQSKTSRRSSRRPSWPLRKRSHFSQTSASTSSRLVKMAKARTFSCRQHPWTNMLPRRQELTTWTCAPRSLGTQRPRSHSNGSLTTPLLLCIRDFGPKRFCLRALIRIWSCLARGICQTKSLFMMRLARLGKIKRAEMLLLSLLGPSFKMPPSWWPESSMNCPIRSGRLSIVTKCD